MITVVSMIMMFNCANDLTLVAIPPVIVPFGPGAIQSFSNLNSYVNPTLAATDAKRSTSAPPNSPED